jgi:hypothetical protein
VVVVSVVGAGGSVVVVTVVTGASVVVGGTVVVVVVRGAVVVARVVVRVIVGLAVRGTWVEVRTCCVVLAAVVPGASVVGGGGARFGVSGVSRENVVVVVVVLGLVAPKDRVGVVPSVSSGPAASRSWVALAACGVSGPSPARPTTNRYPTSGRVTKARPAAEPSASFSGHPGRVPRCVPT